jgi:hypothetical protein
MKATQLIHRRIAESEQAFAEYVIWELAKPLPGSRHKYKYRLAYVVNGECVLRYDNESGKGNHRHFGLIETTYIFSTPNKLMADFQRDIARWKRENSRT